MNLCGWIVDRSARAINGLWVEVNQNQSPMEEKKENNCHFLAMQGVEWRLG